MLKSLKVKRNCKIKVKTVGKNAHQPKKLAKGPLTNTLFLGWGFAGWVGGCGRWSWHWSYMEQSVKQHAVNSWGFLTFHHWIIEAVSRNTMGSEFHKDMYKERFNHIALHI